MKINDIITNIKQPTIQTMKDNGRSQALLSSANIDSYLLQKTFDSDIDVDIETDFNDEELSPSSELFKGLYDFLPKDV